MQLRYYDLPVCCDYCCLPFSSVHAVSVLAARPICCATAPMQRPPLHCGGPVPLPCLRLLVRQGCPCKPAVSPALSGCSFSQGFCCTCLSYSSTDLKRGAIQCGGFLGWGNTQSAHCLRFHPDWWHAVRLACCLGSARWRLQSVWQMGDPASCRQPCSDAAPQRIHAQTLTCKQWLQQPRIVLPPCSPFPGLPNRGVCAQVPHQPECDHCHASFNIEWHSLQRDLQQRRQPAGGPSRQPPATQQRQQQQQQQQNRGADPLALPAVPAGCHQASLGSAGGRHGGIPARSSAGWQVAHDSLWRR